MLIASTSARRVLGALLVLAVLAGLAIAAIFALARRGEEPLAQPAPAFAPTAQQIQRGEYLARVGDCIACHTPQGSQPFAGGLPLATPFGTVYTPNITSDAEAGIGRWSAAEFWRAMHHGRARDGRMLYPAFPYPSYTQVTREDSDAIYAYLQSVPPSAQRNQPHDVGFPYNTALAMAVWRALFFTPGSFVPEPARSAEWNRGAYLVQGLAHCSACHSPRNALGASSTAQPLGGGLMAGQNWYAPSLHSPHEAGLAEWPVEEVVQLLQTGLTPRASVMGPMAEVISNSTQYLSGPDLRAMAVYLRALPQEQAHRPVSKAADAQAMARGSNIYSKQCAQCHGDRGEGRAGQFPALAGNRAVLLDSPVNVVQIVLNGGFQAQTAGNPRPFGMPPFLHVLDDDEVAAVSTFIRNAWGNRADPVDGFAVRRLR
ncbi:c-type cytochrome [Xylophilus sp. GW821-FHT01B05]